LSDEQHDEHDEHDGPMNHAPAPEPSEEQRWRRQALRELLHRVNDLGVLVVSWGELLRLTGAGNTRRMVRLLHETWIDLGYPAAELTVFQTPWQGNFSLHRAKPEHVRLLHGQKAAG
jgi:hypothetical protein